MDTLVRKNPSEIRNLWRVIAVGFAVTLTGSSCLVTSVNDEDLDANEVYQLTGGGSGGAASSCAQNVFRSVVHTQLVGNCATCHSNSFASSSLTSAYAAAKSRANFGTPSSSRLVGQGSDYGASRDGHCGNCGGTLGNAFASAIDTWGKAERNDATICAQYANVVVGDANTAPFDLGAYVPPNPNDTVVIQDGLNEFRSAGGVQSILVANCAQCHVPGGISSLAPFAVADATTAYKQSKPRTNFGNLDASLILQRAGVPNHGGGCAICGNAGFVAGLRAEVQAWAAQENAGVAASHVRLTAKQIYNGTAAVQPTSWDLGADTSPLQGTLNATFSIRVSLSNASTLRFANPTIVNNGTRPIRVKKIGFVVNNVLNATTTSYHTVDLRVAAGETKVLATFPALMSIPAPTAGAKSLIVDFEILQGE